MLTQPWFAAPLAMTGALTGVITGMTQASPVMASVSPAQLEQQGWQAYHTDSLGQAVDLWQQAAHSYLMAQETLGQARVMGSIALVHQRLGDWEEARNALETGHSLLKISTKRNRSERSKAQSESAQPEPVQPSELMGQQVLGQLTEAEARLHRAMGQTHLEQERWREATAIYQALGDVEAQWRCQLFQIQAQQHLGQPESALEQLATLQAQIQAQSQAQSQSQAKFQAELQAKFQAKIQQQQAIAHWQLGNLPQAQRLLENLLKTEAAAHPNLKAQAHLVLGHLYTLQAQPTLAVGAYQTAAQFSLYKTQALESLLHLYLDLPHLPDAAQWEPLWAELEQQWKQTSPNQVQLYRRMGVIQHLTQGHLSPQQLSSLEALAYDNIQRAYSLGTIGSPHTAAIAEAMITLAQVHRAAGEPDKALSLLQEAEQTALNLTELRSRSQNQRSQIQLHLDTNRASTDRASVHPVNENSESQGWLQWWLQTQAWHYTDLD